MTLTPVDIYNKEFKTAWKGYNREQVDAFLDQVIVDFKSLLEGDGEVKTSADEVRLKRFARATRGYDPDDVDAFLLEVAQEYSELLGQRRRAEEAARARKAAHQAAMAPAPAPEPEPEPVVAPAPVRAPEPEPEPEPVVMPAPTLAPAAEPIAIPAPAADPVVLPIAQPAPTPSRVVSATGVPVEIASGGATIRLSLSGGRVFMTLEAQDLTVRKELDANAARRLGDALLRMSETLDR